MAAPTSDWDDIDEKFLQCAICLEQLHEPKQLPCLHRFCLKCLGKLPQKSAGVINCPECMEKIAVPEEGVNGFKTDFYLKNIIEFVRLKKSLLENTETKECCSCSQFEQVSAYCLKCRGFLCEVCHQSHRTDTMTRDHVPSILDLKDPTILKLGIAKLSNLMDSPRCLQHPEYIMRLCCVTCGDDPICIVCATGDHGDHKKMDINTMARMKKVEMEENLELLRGCKNGIYQLQDNVKSAAVNTDSLFERRKKSLKDCYKNQLHLLEKIREDIELQRRNRISRAEKKYEDSIVTLKTEMEEEIQKIRDKYAKLLHRKVIEKDELLQGIEEALTCKFSILEERERSVAKRFEDSEKVLHTYKEKADVRLTSALEHSANIMDRYENLNATASSILAADNDWTIFQCFPDIASAVKPLSEDLANALTALTTISPLPPPEVPLPVDVTDFRRSYRETVECIQCENVDLNSSIDGVARVSGEDIIIYGQTGNESLYSLCMNIQGKVLWSNVTECFFRISQNDVQAHKMKAAVMCFPDALQTLNRGIRKKNLFSGIQLNEIIPDWPKGFSLQCVAADTLKKRLFVSFRECRKIYVFNGELKLVEIFSLPSKATHPPDDLTVSVEGLLIVCDSRGKSVFSTNLKGVIQSTYRLPLVDGCDNWVPQSICADSKDNVFILLSASEFGKIVVQYPRYGSDPLAFRRVWQSEIAHVAVTQVDQKDHLLLLRSKCRAFVVYLTHLKMAAPTSEWDDIDEKFLQCAICLEQLHEPKQLPCLHRFCFKCLGKLPEQSAGVINCPECMEEIAIPEHGVDGFKTDFYLKNIIEFVRLKTSLVENTETKECCSCSKMEQVSAYCLKCRGFLCEACDKIHRTDAKTRAHDPSILDLKDPTILKLGIAKLSKLMDSPRCLQHPEYIMRLCCVTCGDDPICVICATGDHGDHKKMDINTMARMKKVEMEENLKLLRGCKNGIYQLQDNVKSAAVNTDSIFERRKKSLKDCYKNQLHLLEKIRGDIQLQRRNRISRAEKKYEDSAVRLKTEMEDEIQKIRNKYANILHRKVVEKDELLQGIEETLTCKLSILEERERSVAKRFEDSEKVLQTYKEKIDVKFTSALENSTNIMKRYENLTSTASSILAADNDWTIFQCIPDITSAVKPLLEDMANALTALTTNSPLPPLEVPLPVEITDFGRHYCESIKCIVCENVDTSSSIDGVVSVPGEGVIIYGQTAGAGGLYSLCMNIEGEVLWSDVQPEYFLSFSQNDMEAYKMKAAVVGFPDALQTLNRGTQKKSLIWGIQLNEIVHGWPKDLSLQCVATDTLKKRIFASFRECRKIHVFNDKLKLVKIFSLPPKAIHPPDDLAVSVRGLLIVCDSRGKSVFSANLNGEIHSTYSLPSVDGCDNWVPQSVCADSNDNVFILLSSSKLEKIVVQYAKHGSNPLAFRRVWSEIAYVTVTQVNQKDHLLLLRSTCKAFVVSRTTPESDEHEKVEEESHEREDSPVLSVQTQGVEVQEREETK